MTRSRDVADTQDNLGGAVAPFVAGKNKIINGDFGIWQRGTSFSNPATTAYTADRWRVQQDGTGATRVISQQTFTPGAAPVAGYEGTYFARYAVSVAGTGNTFQNFEYNQEDVRTFAGQTVTWSFWAKADASRTVALLYRRDFGTGGSSADQYSVGSVTLTTSWVRYSVTYAVPSVSGLTIGTSSYGTWIFRPPAATVQTIDIWGVQLEAGSVATPFTTASGSIGGELALCQRYYVRYSAADLSLGNYAQLSQTGFCVTTALANLPFAAPATLRTKPTSVDYANVELLDTQAISVISGGTFTVANGTGTQTLSTLYTHTAATLTAGKQVILRNSNNVNGYFGWSAEL